MKYLLFFLALFVGYLFALNFSTSVVFIAIALIGFLMLAFHISSFGDLLAIWEGYSALVLVLFSFVAGALIGELLSFITYAGPDDFVTNLKSLLLP